MSYILQNWAVLWYKYLSYETPNLQRQSFGEDCTLRICKPFGLMSCDDKAEFSRKWMPVNTVLKLKNAAHISFCSRRISHHVIQCDGFFREANPPNFLKDTRKSILNLAVPAIRPAEEQLLAPGQSTYANTGSWVMIKQMGWYPPLFWIFLCLLNAAVLPHSSIKL